jgi:hypothetical protein
MPFFIVSAMPRVVFIAVPTESLLPEVRAVRLFLSALVVSFTTFVTAPAAFAEQWTQPTAEELSMTSQAGAPNASAVILFHEEIADDNLRMHSEYVRIKVLSEAGKSQADVEIPFIGRVYTITDAAGRTIHSDGTVIPFTGKPYEKTIVKSRDYS